MSDSQRNTFITCGVVACLLGFIWLFIPKSQVIDVDELYWRYTINFETLETSYGEGWDLPFGADVYSKEERFRGYENKFVGYNEDGSSKYEEVKIYDYYYYYTVDEWQVTRTEVTQGTIDEEPYWGSFDCILGERLGAKTKEYLVSADSKYYSVGYDNWLRLQRNELNNVKVSMNYITSIN